MRVITVRQPWAWAIVHLGKDVENRTRNIAGSYRGQVAIHAASREASPYNEVAAEVFRLGGQWVFASDLGAIIGVVDLVNVHHDQDCWHKPWKHEVESRCSQWAMEDHHHLELANPRAIDPIPAKGKLGLWRPDAELLAQIEAAL